MKLTVKYEALAPISHIGETSSTGSYFQSVLTKNGRIPIITGNSVRGTLRDCAAKYLLDKTGTIVSKEVFDVLFSGGNINAAMKNDVERSKQVRKHFPMISLFGGGLGTMIMAGKLLVGNLYPICQETADILDLDVGTDVSVSWKSLIDEIEFTRTDDTKDDQLVKYIIDTEEERKGMATTQMRYSVQYMAKGTMFIQDMYVMDPATPEEYGALFSAFNEWFKMPFLGGMANKGFGAFRAVARDGEKRELITTNGIVSKEIEDSINAYNNVVLNSGEYFDLLGVKKNGKAKK